MELESLQQTLVRLGVGEIKAENLTILKESSPSMERNAFVYNRCNELMLAELRKQSIGPMFHVTGEMRALSDPRHREVCRISTRFYGIPAKICAYLPPEHRVTGRDVWKWNKKHWPPTNWRNHLDVFHLLADQEAILYGLGTLEEMHFSLFGKSHVLLQEHHDHDKHTKRVWFVESQELRDALVPTVRRCFENAINIPARIFSGFAALLSDPIHLDILFRLRQGEEISAKKLASLCESFGTTFYEVAEDLLTCEFISNAGEQYKLTKEGEEFLAPF